MFWQNSERFQKDRCGTKCLEKIAENIDFTKCSNYIRRSTDTAVRVSCDVDSQE